ncbi:hypothetical protein D3C71_2146640 [compost metagenome]
MQHHLSIALHHEEFPMHGGDHLAQGISHGSQVEMKSESSFNATFRRNDGPVEGNGKLMSKVIHVRAGIAA